MSSETVEQPPTRRPLEPLVGRPLNRRSFLLAVCSGLLAAVVCPVNQVQARSPRWVPNEGGDYFGPPIIRVRRYAPQIQIWDENVRTLKDHLDQ